MHVHGSAHMCNRCVISASRPHHCCQHVGSSTCETGDCFTEVIELERPIFPANPRIHCGKVKNSHPRVVASVLLRVVKCGFCASVSVNACCAISDCVSSLRSKETLWDSSGTVG